MKVHRYMTVRRTDVGDGLHTTCYGHDRQRAVDSLGAGAELLHLQIDTDTFDVQAYLEKPAAQEMKK